jgi:predicted RNA-binding Zn ribbon-like protein
MDGSHKAEFRLVGGHVALNLVNTVAPRSPGGGEHTDFLPSPARLLTWSTEVGVVGDADAARVERDWAAHPRAADRALRAVIEIRESAYALLAAALGADVADPQAERDLLTRHWSAAAGRSQLVAGGGGTGIARVEVGTTPALMLVDRLAVAAVDLLGSVDVARLRSCPVEAGGCGWLFLDTSRNGSRRWCSMDDCGAQSKSRRLTDRRRDFRRRSVGQMA